MSTQSEYIFTHKRTTNELENECSSAPDTKRVLLDGWDAANNAKVRIAVSSGGQFGVPTTVTISSASTTNANWTNIASAQTGILEWRLSEENGNDFHYAFTSAAASAYSIGWGWVGGKTSPSEIWVKRPSTTNIIMKLEKWSA